MVSHGVRSVVAAREAVDLAARVQPPSDTQMPVKQEVPARPRYVTQMPRDATGVADRLSSG